MALVLIVDDDDIFSGYLGEAVEEAGHSPLLAHSLKEGMRLQSIHAPDLIFLDVRLPDGDGLDRLSGFRFGPGSPEVVIVTAVADPEAAELSIRNGAWDYLCKPCTLEDVLGVLERALEYRGDRSIKEPCFSLRKDIKGHSPAMRDSLLQLAQAASSEAGVLITGETGTGKELFSKALHEMSSRAKGSFVVVDCAALPANLVESTLFGHERGAYTGADRSSPGLLAGAHGGTLFLDEVGEMPLPVQKTFLRVLQERRYRRVGGTTELESDFRLVAATNRDLDRMVAQGEFRSDLLFRLRAFTIELQPLRKRPEDLCELVPYILARIGTRECREIRSADDRLMELLMAYHWPGNVRELYNVLERAVAAAGENPGLRQQDLPVEMRAIAVRNSLSGKTEEFPSSAEPGQRVDMPPLKDVVARALAETEKRYLADLMRNVKGDVANACRISGLSRSRLYVRLKSYGIPRPSMADY